VDTVRLPIVAGDIVQALYGTVRHRELSRERKEMGTQKGKCQEQGTSGTVQQGQLSGILGHGEVRSGDR
jgi:hypothetical protein